MRRRPSRIVLRQSNSLLSLIAHLDHISTHVISTLGTYNVSRHASAAVRAIAGLLLLDIVV